jgi:hypothetical protein
MIKKIISGGQTGVDQAALDAAIKWNIPHGGWVPKGRLTEAGKLSDKYRMQEMPTDSYAGRTERNVTDSDGTLIISHGPLTDGSKYTREMTSKHQKSCLHIDLNETDVSTAARQIYDWVIRTKIQILNVAGSRASTDPSIYQATLHVLTNVLIMDLIEISMSEPQSEMQFKSSTIDKAVESLISRMTLRERCYIGNMSQLQIERLDATLGDHIRETLGNRSSNKTLIETCKSLLGKDEITDLEVSRVVIKALWEKLHETHGLKIVKK